MASGTRVCKICGTEYPYCKTVGVKGEFRWQDVACCPEHGIEYFRAVLAGRNDNRVLGIVSGNVVVEDIVKEEIPAPKKTRRKVVKEPEIKSDELEG